MRISTLEFQGFGPYKDRQYIDFDQLGDSGLYLINGPTGAGKSTVIDAICFALYGKLASDDADPARARSDFCGPDDPTRVVLVFECSAGRFKVERSPEYLKAKKRGEGVTKAKARCNVYRVLPSGEEASIDDGVPDANREIPKLVGLSRDQFVQTVVLPQGKFANFLNAKTQEREEILKSIFNTGLYEKVADLLKDRAKAIRDRNQDLGQQIAFIVRQLAESAEVSDEDASAAEQFSRDSLDDALSETLEAWALPIAQCFEAAEQAAAFAQDAFDTADAERTRAREEHTAREQVESAESAKSAADKRYAQAREGIAAHAGILSTLEVTNTEGMSIADWDACAKRVASQLDKLEELRALEDEIDQWPNVEEATRHGIEDLAARLEELQELSDALPKLIEEQEGIQAKRPKAAEWQELAVRRSAIKEIQQSRQELDNEQAKIIELEDKVRAVQKSARAASDELMNGSRSYLAGIASDLASSLEEGVPCVVCGSPDHPSPASATEGSITYEAVEALREKDRHAHAEVERLSNSLEGARDSALALQGRLTMTPDEEERQRKQVEEFASRLKSRDEAATDAESELGRLRTEQTERSDEMATLRTDIETQKQALQTAIIDVAGKRQKVEAGRHGFDTISARMAALELLESEVTDFITALRGAEAAEREVTKAMESLAALPVREGFADVSAAEQAWEAANKANNETNETLVKARTAHEDFTKQRQKITALCEERAALVGDNLGLMRLAEIFDSGRGTDYGLHIYVLRTLFDTVMTLANQRFESLLDGRYRLVAQDDSTGDQRKHHGLGVAVQDALTGKVRSAKSLSGGETFCASLALALGLSDAVRMNAGGIRIESLFIDEGFGSLDNSQLDEVMNMLNQLSTNGRRVGLISHVDSMKETIPERINVHAVRQGRPTSLSVSWMQ